MAVDAPQTKMRPARFTCGGHTMQTKTVTDLAKLTKEEIGEIYFRSLQNTHTRKNHVQLVGVNNSNPATPKTIEGDCTPWYAGFVGLGTWFEPNVELPSMPEVVAYISKNFERARTAIAA